MDPIQYLEEKQELYLDLDKLSKHPLVESISTNLNLNIKIKFKTGLSYKCKQRSLMHIPRLKGGVKINNQFNIYSLEDHQKVRDSINLHPKYYKNSAVLDLELAKQIFIDSILNNDFVVDYPFHILKKDYESILDSHYDVGDTIRLMAPSNRGRYVQEQFTNFRTLPHVRPFLETWKDPHVLYFHINKLMSKKKPVNRTTVLRSIRRAAGRRARKVGVYLALFKKFNLQYKWIHDIDCFSWSKAIAASKLNMYYTFSNVDYIGISQRFNEFLDQMGITPNTAYKALPDTGADILLLDGNFDSIQNVDDYKNFLGKNYNDILYLTEEPSEKAIKIDRGNILRENIFIQLLSEK